MIFGEYLGEVVSNGEYEVRAQGTTNAGLKDAIKSLTDTEYLDSFLMISSSASGTTLTIDAIFNPIDGRFGVARSYVFDHTPATAQQIARRLFVQYAYSIDNVVANRVEVSTTPALTSSFSANQQFNEASNTLTIDSWKLYTRKQTLAIPGAGDEPEIIATSSVGLTYAQQLTELQTAWNSLSLKDQYRSALLDIGTSATYVLRCINPASNWGRFSGTVVGGTDNTDYVVSNITCSIPSATYLQSATRPNGTTMTNYTNTTNTGGYLQLILL